MKTGILQELGAYCDRDNREELEELRKQAHEQENTRMGTRCKPSISFFINVSFVLAGAYVRSSLVYGNEARFEALDLKPL